MSRAAALPGELDRRFEALIFDWDGTAVPDRTADASAVRTAVQAACVLGLDVAVVSGTHVGNIDGQLRARPRGPGELHLLLNRGSEVFHANAEGIELLARRTASDPEERALDRAAALTVERLGAAGPRGEDRLAAAEPPQDRPDPDARVGGPAEGAHRRAARGGAGAAERARARWTGSGSRAGRGGRGRGRARRCPGDERRQARRDRPHRQVRLRPLVLRESVAAWRCARSGSDRRRRARIARRPCGQRLQAARSTPPPAPRWHRSGSSRPAFRPGCSRSAAGPPRSSSCSSASFSCAGAAPCRSWHPTPAGRFASRTSSASASTSALKKRC